MTKSPRNNVDRTRDRPHTSGCESNRASQLYNCDRVRWLRDDSHKKQFLLGRFDWDGSHKISNGIVRTTLSGRFAQNLIYWDNSSFLMFKMKKKSFQVEFSSFLNKQF